MIYEDAIKLLTCSGKFRVELGLDRMYKILELLGNPQDSLKCIHVAGTNGKGSVCAIIDSVLREAGIKTGLYTSPHIFEYTERIKISGVDISQGEFGDYVEYISDIADSNSINLTEFEIITAVMFKYFKDKGVDVAVLETGLGGRFDATNVIKTNLCSIITHIDYDHTERLGNTLEKIAFEKAGIIKENSIVFTSEGYESIKNEADKKNSLLVLVTPLEDISNLALKGLHQQANLSLALAAVRRLFPQISEDTIQNGIKNIKHPFRFQFFKEKNMIIDAAHNPNGIMALKENLDFYYPNFKKRFIFGCLKNKDYKSMILSLFNSNDEIYFYHFNYPNSASVEDLIKVCPYPAKEFTTGSIDFNDGKLTVICGSFYMIKEITAKL